MPETDTDKKNVKTPSRTWLFRLAFAFAALVLAAIGIRFGVSHAHETASPQAPEIQVKSTVHLDAFVLNLADPDQRSYLRVGIDLGLNQEPKHGEQAPVAQLRDAILGVLSQGKVDELLTPEGKSKLKENLLRALRQQVPQAGVEEVYFTEFLIQR